MSVDVSPPTAQFPGDSNQLSTLLTNARDQSFHLQQAIISDSLAQALRHASLLLSGLSSSLPPREYYQLYLFVSEQLTGSLLPFLEDRARHGRKLAEVYETVQHAGNIVPRVYLLVVAGIALVKAGEADGPEIVRDVMELCRGVQDPVRGVFLRHFVAGGLKDWLTVINAGHSGASEASVSTTTAVDLVISNLVEASKLWIRLGARRQRERHELRVLVGANMVRLSAVEGVSKELYQQRILPALLHQICDNFQDTLAQQYLLDCIVQVFPDDFQIATLSDFLAGCARSLPGVDLRGVVVNLMRRLKMHAEQQQREADSALLPDRPGLFSVFHPHLQRIVARAFEAAPTLSDTPTVAVGSTSGGDLVERTSQLLELLHSFLEFACSSACGGSHTDRIAAVLKMALSLVAKYGEEQPLSNLAGKTEALEDLLVAPFEEAEVADVLAVPEFAILAGLIPINYKRRAGRKIVRAVSEQVKKKMTGNLIPDSETLSRLLAILEPCLDTRQQVTVEDPEEEAAAAKREIEDLAMLVHAVSGSFQLIQELGNFLSRSGVNRTPILLPGLVSAALGIIGNLETQQLTPKKVFHFVHKTISSLRGKATLKSEINQWLLAARSAASVDQAAIAAEFVTQALLAFEEEGGGLKEAQMLAEGLRAVAGKIENFDTLSVKTAQFAARILKKADACRAVCSCAVLFWNDSPARDGKKLIDCLQKGVKLADACVQAQGTGGEVFVDVLEHYLYFFQVTSGEVITAGFVNGLLSLCREHAEFAATQGDLEIMKKLNLIQNWIREQKRELFAGLEV